MTTIAYRGGIVAVDTLVVAGGVVVDHFGEKTATKDGVMFFFAGSVSDIHKLIDEYFSSAGNDVGNISAIVIDQGNIIKVGGEEDGKGIWKCPQRRENHIAIGSGQDFALAAMDFGNSAKEAIEYAMTRDIYTGGEVRFYRV